MSDPHRGVSIDIAGPHEASRPVQGHLDGLDEQGRSISGWAYDNGEPVDVWVSEGDNVLVLGHAANYRRDLEAAGIGDGRHGYSLRLPDRYLDGRVHRLVVTCASSSGAKPLVSELIAEVSLSWPARVPTVRAPIRSVSGDLYYVPGTPIQCRTASGEISYLTSGWSQPDEHCVWMTGREATIEFMVRRPVHGYVLQLDLVIGDATEQPTMLNLFFNYMWVGTTEISISGVSNFTLPSPLFLFRQSRLVLHRTGEATQPRAIGLRAWSVG